MARVRSGPCAAPSLFVVLLLPLLAAACPSSPMSSAATPYGYETGTEAAAYPTPYVAAPCAAPAAASPRAETPVAPEAATASPASPRAEKPSPVAPEAATASPASPRAEKPSPVAPEATTAPPASPRADEESPVAREGAPASPRRDRRQEEIRQGAAVDGEHGEHVERLEELAKTLDFLGYRKMASSTSLLVSSPVLSSWPGPWTVFAIPDPVFMAGCPAHACIHVLMEHVALGATVRSDVAAEPDFTTKVSTAAVGKCLTLSASINGPEKLWVSGVEVSEVDLYKDDRLVIHGVKSMVKVKRRSCSVDSRRRRLARLNSQDGAELFRDVFALMAA